MGRFLLLLVAAVTLAAGISLSRGSVRGTDDVADHRDRMIARTIALSGHEATRQQVAARYEAAGSYTGTTSFSGNYQNGTYASSVTISSKGRDVAITTTSTFNDTEYVVRASYVAGASYKTTDFMAGGTVTGGSLRAWHPLTVRSVAPNMNASVRVNGDIEFKVQSDPSVVEGFGYYSGSATLSSSQIDTDIFQPIANPDGTAVLQQAPPIDIPRIDIEDYRSVATKVFKKNTVLSSDITLGTREAPEVWLFEGALNTLNTLTVTGYGALVVKGKVKFMGDINAADGTDSAFSVLSESDIDLMNAQHVEANIMTNGQLELKHGADLYGNLTLLGNLRTKGPNKIYFRPMLESLGEKLWPDEPKVETTTTLGSLTLVEFWESGRQS